MGSWGGDPSELGLGTDLFWGHGCEGEGGGACLLVGVGCFTLVALSSVVR